MISNISKVLALLAAGTTISSCSSRPGKDHSQQPNIIYIMSDDHGYQAISAYNDDLIQTPNIDRLAKEGAIFTSGFVTNSLCAPSRAVMLTGKHSFINGKVDNVQPFNWDQESWPKLLQQNGYQTALVGKIHLDGIPQGFDYSAVLPGQGHYYNPDFIVNGKKEQIHGYVTDVITNLALDWLKQRDPDKPFCLLYHHKAPHREWLPDAKHFREYTHKTFKEPETLFDDHEGMGIAARKAEMSILKNMNWSGDSKIYPEVMDELGIEECTDWGRRAFDNNLGRMDEQQRAAWDSVYMPMNEAFKNEYPNMSEQEKMHWRYERYMQDYLACIASVDDGVGRVLDYLDKNDLADNTIVVYTSDQGMYLGEHGWFDKRFMYKQSFRTPILMRYPEDIKPGTVVDKMVQNLDFAPTFLDYAGVKIPDDMQGESFRRLVEGDTTNWRDALYYTYYEYPSIHMAKRHYGIRTERYKLIHFYYDIDQWELYDMEKDPNELHNVYGEPEYADVQVSMHKKLNELRQKYGDSDSLDQRYLKEYLEAINK